MWRKLFEFDQSAGGHVSEIDHTKRTNRLSFGPRLKGRKNCARLARDYLECIDRIKRFCVDDFDVSLGPIWVVFDSCNVRFHTSKKVA